MPWRTKSRFSKLLNSSSKSKIFIIKFSKMIAFIFYCCITTTKCSALNNHSFVSSKFYNLEENWHIKALCLWSQKALNQAGLSSGGSRRESATKCIWVFFRIHFLVIIVCSSCVPAECQHLQVTCIAHLRMSVLHL